MRSALAILTLYLLFLPYIQGCERVVSWERRPDSSEICNPRSNTTLNALVTLPDKGKGILGCLVVSGDKSTPLRQPAKLMDTGALHLWDQQDGSYIAQSIPLGVRDENEKLRFQFYGSIQTNNLDCTNLTATSYQSQLKSLDDEPNSLGGLPFVFMIEFQTEPQKEQPADWSPPFSFITPDIDTTAACAMYLNTKTQNPPEQTPPDTPPVGPEPTIKPEPPIQPDQEPLSCHPQTCVWKAAGASSTLNIQGNVIASISWDTSPQSKSNLFAFCDKQHKCHYGSFDRTSKTFTPGPSITKPGLLETLPGVKDAFVFAHVEALQSGQHQLHVHTGNWGVQHQSRNPVGRVSAPNANIFDIAVGNEGKSIFVLLETMDLYEFQAGGAPIKVGEQLQGSRLSSEQIAPGQSYSVGRIIPVPATNAGTKDSVLLLGLEPQKASLVRVHHPDLNGGYRAELRPLPPEYGHPSTAAFIKKKGQFLFGTNTGKLLWLGKAFQFVNELPPTSNPPPPVVPNLIKGLFVHQTSEEMFASFEQLPGSKKRIRFWVAQESAAGPTPYKEKAPPLQEGSTPWSASTFADPCTFITAAGQTLQAYQCVNP